MGRPRKRRHDGIHSDHASHSVSSSVQVPDAPTATPQLGIPELETVAAGLSSSETGRSLDVAPNMESNFQLPGDWEALQKLNQAVSAQLDMRDVFNRLDEPNNQEDVPVTQTFPTGSETTCQCLKILYSTLSSFQSLPPPSFPLSRGPLMQGMNVAREVVRCAQCPLTYASAFQNLMLLGTLLPLIVNEYAKILKYVQEEAAKGKTTTYRVGDQSLENLHFHTGTFDCPMGFSLELDSEEWASMARKVVRQDVHGTSGSEECVVKVVDELEERQHLWHIFQPFSADAQNMACRNQELPEQGQHGGMCMQLIENIRRAINALDL